MKLHLGLLLLISALPAVAQPQHAKRIAPTTEATHLNNLGAAYMNQQQFARALGLFRRAAALNPKLEIAKINQGIALANLQKYESAITVLTPFTKKNHANAHAWYTLGLVYKNEANSEKSLEAFEAA